jgi:hypothetical protein
MPATSAFKVNLRPGLRASDECLGDQPTPRRPAPPNPATVFRRPSGRPDQSLATGSGAPCSGTVNGWSGAGDRANQPTSNPSLTAAAARWEGPGWSEAPPPEMQHFRPPPRPPRFPPAAFPRAPFSCPYLTSKSLRATFLLPSPLLKPPGSKCFPSPTSTPAPPDSEGRERTGLRTGGGAAPASRSCSDAAAATTSLRSPARAPRQLRSALATAAAAAPPIRPLACRVTPGTSLQRQPRGS